MEDQAAPSPGDAPHPLTGWTLFQSCRGGQRRKRCFKNMQPGGGRGLQRTPRAGDTCHSRARSLEFVCASAAPWLSAGVCCDRTGTVCRGRGSSTALCEVEASITAAREVEATTDAATPTNKNTDQSSKSLFVYLLHFLI